MRNSNRLTSATDTGRPVQTTLDAYIQKAINDKKRDSGSTRSTIEIAETQNAWMHRNEGAGGGAVGDSGVKKSVAMTRGTVNVTTTWPTIIAGSDDSNIRTVSARRPIALEAVLPSGILSPLPCPTSSTRINDSHTWLNSAKHVRVTNDAVVVATTISSPKSIVVTTTANADSPGTDRIVYTANDTTITVNTNLGHLNVIQIDEDVNTLVLNRNNDFGPDFYRSFTSPNFRQSNDDASDTDVSDDVISLSSSSGDDDEWYATGNVHGSDVVWQENWRRSKISVSDRKELCEHHQSWLYDKVVVPGNCRKKTCVGYGNHRICYVAPLLNGYIVTVYKNEGVVPFYDMTLKSFMNLIADVYHTVTNAKGVSEMYHQEQNNDTPSSDCPVCMDSLSPLCQLQDCSHSICFSCIVMIVITCINSIDDNKRYRCPLCRAPLHLQTVLEPVIDKYVKINDEEVLPRFVRRPGIVRPRAIRGTRV